MGQIGIQGGNGISLGAAAAAMLALWPARTRNGPDENEAAEKLPMSAGR